MAWTKQRKTRAVHSELGTAVLPTFSLCLLAKCSCWDDFTLQHACLISMSSGGEKAKVRTNERKEFKTEGGQETKYPGMSMHRYAWWYYQWESWLGFFKKYQINCSVSQIKIQFAVILILQWNNWAHTICRSSDLLKLCCENLGHFHNNILRTGRLCLVVLI